MVPKPQLAVRGKHALRKVCKVWGHGPQRYITRMALKSSLTRGASPPSLRSTAVQGITPQLTMASAVAPALAARSRPFSAAAATPRRSEPVHNLREFAQTPVILANGRAWKERSEQHFLTRLLGILGIPGMSSKKHSQNMILK